MNAVCLSEGYECDVGSALHWTDCPQALSLQVSNRPDSAATALMRFLFIGFAMQGVLPDQFAGRVG